MRRFVPKLVYLTVTAVVLSVFLFSLSSGIQPEIVTGEISDINLILRDSSKDIRETEERIKEKKKPPEPVISDSSEEIAAVSPTEKISNRERFENTVFMGDSLTTPLNYFGILNESSVLAYPGENLTSALEDENMEKLKGLQPQNIVMLFGINDVNMLDVEKEFIYLYRNLTDKVRSTVPEAQIYIIAVTAVSTEAQIEFPGYEEGRIASFNNALEKFAVENGFIYINVNDIINAHQEFFDPDGIHLGKDFYELYLERIRSVMDMKEEERTGGRAE